MAAKIRKGDKVVVLTGRDKGRSGEVIEVRPTEGRALVRGINMVKRHQRQTASQEGGIISKEGTIHLSNLAIADPKTGKPILEKERLPQVKSFYASPIAAAGRIYFTDRSGTTIVLKAGDSIEVLAVNKLDDPVDASPVAVGKQLFLRSHSALYCIEEK